MNKNLKKLLASSIAAFALMGMTASAMAEEQTMPYPGMMGYGSGYGAAGYGPGYGMGPGMMGGMGPGMMGGMGPGMMGGMGPGMMGGMGPGMMGGMGPGMMGGMGPGMMGYGIDLSDAQTSKLEKIHSDLFKKEYDLMSQIGSEQQKLAPLYYSEKPDGAAIGKIYSKISDLQRQMLEARIDAQNKASAVFTKEQKDKMQRGYGRGMMGY